MDNTNPFDLSGVGISALPETATADFTKVLSVSQQKTNNLQQQKQDKLQQLSPATSDADYNTYFTNLLNSQNTPTDGVPESDLVDEVQAALYKGGQGVGHMLTDIGAWATSSMGDGRLSKSLSDINYKTDAEVNKYVDYNPSNAEYRQKQLSDSYDSLMKDPSLGGFGDVVLNALKSAPTALADSSAIIATMPLGGEGLFAKVAEGLNIAADAERANVARTSLEALTKVKNLRAARTAEEPIIAPMTGLIQPIKTTTPQDLNLFRTAPKVDNILIKDNAKAIIHKASILKREGVLNTVTKEKLAKSLKAFNDLMPINRASVTLGSSFAADDARKFKKDNNGKAASIGHVALDTIAQTLMMGADWSTIKMGMGLDTVKKSTADKVKNIFLGAKDNIVKATKHGKSYLIGDMLINSAYDVLKVAGAGAATNYVQQWVGIIGAQAGTAKHGSLSDVIANKANQKNAALAGASGAGMTAAMRMAPMAVGVPLKATGIAATNIATKTFQAGQNHLTNLNYAMLSKDKRAEFNAKHEARVQAADAELQAHNDAIDKIKNAKSLDELNNIDDPAVASEVQHIIDSNFGSTTVHNEVRNTKSVEDLMSISGTIAKLAKTQVDKLNKPVNEITPQELIAIKEDIISSNRAMNMANEGKADTELSNKIDSAKTPEELFKMMNEKDSKGNPLLPNELIGRIDSFKGDSNSNKILDEQFNTFKTELKQSIQNNKKSPVMEHVNSKIDSIKNAAIAQHNEAITSKKLKLETERAKDYSYALYKNAKEGVKGIGKYIAGQFSDETVAAVIKAAKTTSDLTSAAAKATLDTVKDADKSTVRAMIDDVARGKVNKRLYDFSKNELEELKKSFKDNKKAQDVINRVQKNQQKAVKAMGLSEDSKSNGLLGWLSNTTKSILNSPLAYRTQGLLHVKLNDLKDSKIIDKVSKVLDSVEKDLKKSDGKKLTPDQEKQLQKLKDTVEKAKVVLEEETKKAQSELTKDSGDSTEQKVANKINSSFSDTVNKILNNELTITDKNVNDLNKEDIGTILSLGHPAFDNAMDNKNNHLTANQLDSIKKASDSIIEHSKLSKEERTLLAKNGVLNYANTVEKSIDSVEKENLANANKGTSLENIDTIRLKEKEVKEAENKLKEFADELGIKICGI